MWDKISTINTARLKIIPLSMSNLYLYINHYHAFCNENGLLYQKKLLEEPIKRALTIKIKNIEKDPSHWYYYTYWLMVNKRSQKEVGTIGFKGLPDQNGIIEIGYGTEKTFRNQGFMSEALKAFIKEFPDKLKRIHQIKAQVAITNRHSIRLLKKTGFIRNSSVENDYFYEFTAIGGVK